MFGEVVMTFVFSILVLNFLILSFDQGFEHRTPLLHFSLEREVVGYLARLGRKSFRRSGTIDCIDVGSEFITLALIITVAASALHAKIFVVIASSEIAAELEVSALHTPPVSSTATRYACGDSVTVGRTTADRFRYHAIKSGLRCIRNALHKTSTLQSNAGSKMRIAFERSSSL